MFVVSVALVNPTDTKAVPSIPRVGETMLMERLIRPAVMDDAPQGVAVLRSSISELCVADHQNDPATLALWLRNKTVESFRHWVALPELLLFVAEVGGVVRGIGSIEASGEIRLCYVQPGFGGQGLGTALVETMEGAAREWGLSTVHLTSSVTARKFYERCGYHSAGDVVACFGAMQGYPFIKALS